MDKFFLRATYTDYIDSISKEKVKMEEEIAATPPRPPPPPSNPVGRPRKHPLSLQSSSSSSDPSPSRSPSPSRRGHYINWFESHLLFEIIREVKLQKSPRKAVAVLQQRFSKESPIQQLSHSTVYGWFNIETWELKPEFQLLYEGAERRRGHRQKMVKEEEEKKLCDEIDRLRSIRSIPLSLAIVKSLLNRQLNCDLSLSTVRRLLQRNGFKRRRITSSPLPPGWRQSGIEMINRIALNIAMQWKHPRIPHPSLLINWDQTGIHLVPKSAYTYTRNDDHPSSQGSNDKRQITAIIASSADGDLLPIQLIFHGKTERSEAVLSQEMKIDGIRCTHSDNHWSNQETMQQYLDTIIMPYIHRKIQEHNLPSNQPALCLIDCWPVHVSVQFREMVEKQYPQIKLLFIPVKCTSKLQPADTHLNYPFKAGIRRRFIQHCVDTALDNSPIDLSMKTLKPLVLKWGYHSWKSLKTKKDFVRHAWRSLFDTVGVDPFNIHVQLKVLADEHDKKTEEIIEEETSEDEEEEISDDEEKDENEIAEEIYQNTRRSQRVRRPIDRGLMVRSSELVSYNLSSMENCTYVNYEKYNAAISSK